jgi:hypothetical protein
MSRAKMLIGLVVLAGMLTAMTASAYAEFQSLPTKGQLTTGKITVLKSGALVNKIGANEFQVKCPISAIKAIWELRTTGKIFERVKGPGQQLTKRGPHLDINVLNWGETLGCETEHIGVKVVVLVEPCIIQIHQKAGELTNIKADVVTECRAKTLGCEIKYPVAEEATSKNFQLGNVNLTNSGENLKALANITGMTTNQTKIGGMCPFVGAGVGEVKEFEVEAEGVNAF